MGEWISVKDRLPSLGEDVLICAIGTADGFEGQHEIAISQRFIFRLFPWTEGGNEQWSEPWQYFNADYDVTHWMPLPKPPIEAEPIRHGEWIWDEAYEMFTCSECGKQMIRNDYLYCAFCGAKMEANT